MPSSSRTTRLAPEVPWTTSLRGKIRVAGQIHLEVRQILQYIQNGAVSSPLDLRRGHDLHPRRRRGDPFRRARCGRDHDVHQVLDRRRREVAPGPALGRRLARKTAHQPGREEAAGCVVHRSRTSAGLSTRARRPGLSRPRCWIEQAVIAAEPEGRAGGDSLPKHRYSLRSWCVQYRTTRPGMHSTARDCFPAHW